jgi:hypothetical protein
VEAKATETNYSKMVVSFANIDIFAMFGIPRAIISDVEIHFYSQSFESLLRKYNVTHEISILAKIMNYNIKS